MLFSNLSFWIILLYFAAPSLPGWATKNWLPYTLADSLNIPCRSRAGPIATITIAASSKLFYGGCRRILSDKRVQKIYVAGVCHLVGAIGLGMTIPSLLLLGYGSGLISVVGQPFVSVSDMVCLMQIICLFSASLYHPKSKQPYGGDEYGGGVCRSIYNRPAWPVG